MTVREEAKWCIQQDGMLAEIRKKIRGGKATYEDTAAYSARAGKMIGALFSRRLPEIPPEEREQLCVELLHDQYIDINAAVDAAQRYLDERLGIQLAPQHAPFDSERGHQIGSSLRDLSKPVETLQRRAKAATETTVKSMHDDRMKSEAKFRSRAGLKCFITRKAVSGCCEWCTAMAGRFEYGEEPDDIYRRHDNCDCTVTFENGRKRQDVWSKREWEVPGKDAGAGDKVVLTKEQAKALQAEKQLEVLTKGRSSGKMETEENINHWFEKIGEIDPTDKRTTAQLLHDFEQQYAHSQIEHCRVITDNGEVYDVHGGKWTVDTTLLGEKMRGSTNEHNHVIGESQYSFSWEDLRNSADDGSKIVMAYDEKYRYTMIFPDYSLDENAVYEAYQIADESVCNDLIFAPESVAEGDEQHERIKRACNILGIRYERKGVSG